MTEDSILNYLSSLGEIDGPQDATNRVTNFREIDRYLQQNNNEEIKLLLIEKR